MMPFYDYEILKQYLQIFTVAIFCGMLFSCLPIFLSRLVDWVFRFFHWLFPDNKKLG